MQLIIVDCDLGSVSGPGMEPLPPPVRRNLTKAVRAVLHGNLGNLDDPVRLSRPLAPSGGGGVEGGGGERGGGGAGGGRAGSSGAWTDPSRSVAVVGRGRGGRRSDGGGRDAGDNKAGGSTAGRRRRGGGKGAAAGARRLQARLEALLRLEFAVAMADMLYGFLECLFFLHPERPIFNGARFLQVM